MGQPIFDFVLKMYSATEENLVAEKMTGSDDKVVQKLDEVISALMEANHFTNLSVQPTLSFTSNIARRYRPGGFTFDKFMEYQLEEREMLLKNHLKTKKALHMAEVLF